MKSSTYLHRSIQLLIVLLAITISYGDNSVRIFSKLHQPVTSSTLNWLPVAHRDATREIVIGGFQKIKNGDKLSEDNTDNPIEKDRPMFVCRVLSGGVWVAGSQIDKEERKQCTVTLLGKVYSYDRYELLENVENSARLSWVHWDKFSRIPAGTVSVAVGTDSRFIARHVVTTEENEDNEDDGTGLSYTHYIGTLDITIGLGTINYVKDDGKEGSAVSGEVLIEMEPIFYELTSVKLNHWRRRVIKNESKILGEAIISNSRDEPSKLAEAFPYVYEYLSYWGQGHAMIKALNTSITLVNGTRLPNIGWGLREQENRTDVYTVEIYLEPGTAVNVTLKANYMDIEVPYTGQLVSRYEDQETRSREMNGFRREQTMMNIKPEFSPIYFINNQSIVPTTTSPPSTHMTTGTISTTQKKISTSSISTSSSSSSSSSSSTSNTNNNNIISKSTLSGTISDITKDEDDENLIVPPRKTDNSMQNDDGGPLSLKNKEVNDDNMSNVIESSITVFLTSLIVSLYRIT